MISATPKRGQVPGGFGLPPSRRLRVALRLSRALRGHVEQLARHAYVDEPTGLPNSLAFRHELERAIAAPESNVAVLLLGLDRFGEIDEASGGGDDLLRKVAARLSALPTPGLLLARLGRDELGIVVRCDADEAQVLARRLLQALQQPFEVDGISLAIAARIGAAVHPEHGQDADTLMRRAGADAERTQRIALGAELSRAIENEELLLFFQPKVSLATGRIVGVETLVRWEHPRRGLLMPSEFMPYAERSGMIRPLSRYVLERAIRQCSVWQAAAANVHVAVNLTMHDLVDDRLPGEIAVMLRQSGLPPARLELELTETSIMDDPFRVRQMLLRLSELGVRIAIDDFGTGHSSPAYLKQLPVDELKLDRSFVVSMASDANDAMIVRSTIDLTHRLGLTVVAEGVETPETLERLKAFGCDVAQGTLTGRPARAEELTGLLFAETPLTRPLPRRPRLYLLPTPERPAQVELMESRHPLKLLR